MTLIKVCFRPFSYTGLVFASLFFAASVTPSLLPRVPLFQGLLSGLAMAIGYAVGCALCGIITYLEIPSLRPTIKKPTKIFISLIVTVTFLYFLWQMSSWQNGVRQLMEMPPLKFGYTVVAGGISLIFATCLLMTARLFQQLCRIVWVRLERFLPPRLAFVISIFTVGFLTWSLANGFIATILLNSADRIFLATDGMISDGVSQPQEPLFCGSPASLVNWESIGRRGKDFITGGPRKADIDSLWGGDNLQPLRVYVGMREDDSKRYQARLAVNELKRIGGFERSILVVATPTGTGWLDPGAVDSLEYLQGGDTAIVGMQYSYLPSWITILIDPERSIRSARILFEEVYAHWNTLPKNSRPKLYLHGLSLGALGSEVSATLYDVFEDPHQGAVWSGPPFPSRQWQLTTQSRNPGSPEWLPTIRDGALVRFTSQKNTLNTGARWSPIRNVYIQYASDPMIFFSPQLMWKEPEWLSGDRGPDVSPDLRWYPVITFLQIAFDLPMALTVPTGYGHNYSARHYLDAWIAVTDPKNWKEDYREPLLARIVDQTP